MRVRYTAAVAAIAALALVGCDSSGGARSASKGGQAATTLRQSPEKALAEAARKTLAQGTAHYTLELHSTIQGLAPARAMGMGSIDFKHNCSQLNMTFESSGRSFAFSVIYDRGVLYERLPPELGGKSAKPWIKLDLSDVLSGRGGANAQLNANDPGSIVAFLYGAGGITQDGTEVVRGVTTTHYMGRLDPKRAAAQLPPEYSDQYMDLLDRIGASGPTPADLWVDGQSLIRRIQLRGKATVQGRQSTTTTTIEYFDFGAVVEIELPPADQVQ
jgi:hypothetical protein